MTGPRIFGAALILIAVLYVAGVGLGARRGDEAPSPGALDRGWLKTLQTSLVRPRPLVAGDISLAAPATCLQEGAVVSPPGGACLLLIDRGSSPAARQLRLRLVTGSAADVSLEQPGALTLEQTLGPEPGQSWDVYRDGGQVTITCTDSGEAPACRLELMR